MCHKAKAAPIEPPASPAAGCIHILSKIFSFNILPLATQFRATPPAKHKFLILYSSFIDFDNFFGDDFGRILEDFGEDSWKILPSNLPPLLEDFRFASLFCVRLYRATLARRAPALRAQYGGRAWRATEPCQPLEDVGR